MRGNIPSILSLMCSDDREEVVSFQELAGSLVAARFVHPSGLGGGYERRNPRKKVRASPDVIMYETIRDLFRTEVFNRVRP